MSDVIIRVEGLGKKYRIRRERQERYTALRDVISDKMRGVLRPRPPAAPEQPGVEDFWALRDVSFEVRRGEVLGIIGRNGAGKSTLLKILSRITEPTEGRAELDGRVASLLEVGTGFHPELTGRENIYLNGAILGMSRAEIRCKFDEIVAFAEVETFLDTPVKRYSSGMHVRLAFAVAAHLKAEILIVDEVLAVGDAEFQKKCLGKMHEVSRGGRTVLFVSHNMAAVNSLTVRGMVLSSGRMVFIGPSSLAIAHYVQLNNHPNTSKTLIGRGPHTRILAARLIDASDNVVGHYMPGTLLRLEILLETDGASSMSLDALLLDATRSKLAMASSHHFHGLTLPERAGRFRTVLELPPLWLASGTYTFDIATALVNISWDHYIEDAVEFDVISSNPGGLSWEFKQSMGLGALALPFVKPPQFLLEP